jgi:Zn-dependent metalloprotease
VPGIPNDIESIPDVSSLDPMAALERMKKEHKKRDSKAKWNFKNEAYGTYIYVHKKKAYLSYVVSFFADNEKGNPSRYVHFINAKTGKVLYSFDNLQHADGTGPGGNEKVGYYYYGIDYPPFEVTEIDGTCFLNSPHVRTVDLNHGTTGTLPYSFPCYENTHKPINGAYCPMNDAQYFGKVVFDLYNDNYGVPPVPFQLVIKCHYGTNSETAFWNGSSVILGDGYTTFYPLVALDVVSHEVSHGFTDYNSDLIYSGESGGINESFSDMAGEAAKFYMRGTNDFMCGYDIFKDPDAALRYLYDPPLDGRSIDHVDDYYPGMDVHYSSGIFNKAFWLIATSPGWDTQMAFNIFVKANQDYWVPSTNFQQGAAGAQDAAADYGYSYETVRDAFAVVGITSCCEGVDMYVNDITQTISRRGRNYNSNAVVTIWDIDNNPVSGATVYITWSGVVGGSASDTTGTNGTVTFTSSRVKSTGPFTITVDNVTHLFKTYTPALNVETTDTAYY